MTKNNQWQSNYAEVNGIRIHYTRTGGNKPPIILNHGVSDDGLCWTPITKLLEKNFDVIMVDARGHGLSDFPDDFSVETMAKDLIGLIHSLNLSQKPILIGHSMGAQISAYVASLQPQLIDRVILEDPGFGMSLPLIPNFIFRRIARPLFKRLMIKPLIGLSRDELTSKCKKESPKWSEEEIIPWVESKVQFLKNDPIFLFDSLSNSTNDWFSMIQNIECPVLLLTAEKGLTSKKIAIKLVKDVWKNSETIEIKDAGHNIRRENLEDFMKAINTFLKVE